MSSPISPPSTQSPGSRIGVFGGTFDPPHYGHLVIAQEAYARLGLAKVLFVPAGQPPHKPGRAISPPEDRVAMVERAIAGNRAFELCRVDLDRPGPSYTADMLALLQAQLGPAAELYLIVGMDSLADFASWHEPARIISLCRLVAVTRPGYAADPAALERVIPGCSERIILLEAPRLDISATELQRRVAAGLPIRYQVPESVRTYIRRRRLYAP